MQNTGEPQALKLPIPYESQPKQLKAAQPDNAVEIIPADDIPANSQSAEYSVSDSNQPLRESEPKLNLVMLWK